MSDTKTQPVRISRPLLAEIDKAVNQITDEYGIQKYQNRRALLDDAVKILLKMESGVSTA